MCTANTPPTPIILKQISAIISSVNISVCIFNISGYFSKYNQNTLIMTLKIGNNFLILLSNSSVGSSQVDSECSLVCPKGCLYIAVDGCLIYLKSVGRQSPSSPLPSLPSPPSSPYFLAADVLKKLSHLSCRASYSLDFADCVVSF